MQMGKYLYIQDTFDGLFLLMISPQIFACLMFTNGGRIGYE